MVIDDDITGYVHFFENKCIERHNIIYYVVLSVDIYYVVL